MKPLKSKKVNLAICWNSLRNVPPKEFPSIGELEVTTVILDKLKAGIPEFVESVLEEEQINRDIITGKIKPEQINNKRTEYFKESSKLEIEKGEEEVTIEFEDAEFNAFFQQFERWGKNWFPKVEAFLDFRKDMCLANSKPKTMSREEAQEKLK